MEMTYDGALVLPKNYVAMNEEEMTYVEGGVKWKSVYINKTVCSDIVTAITAGGTSATALLGVIPGLGVAPAIVMGVVSACGIGYFQIASNHNGIVIKSLYSNSGVPLGVNLPLIKW